MNVDGHPGTSSQSQSQGIADIIDLRDGNPSLGVFSNALWCIYLRTAVTVMRQAQAAQVQEEAPAKLR